MSTHTSLLEQFSVFFFLEFGWDLGEIYSHSFTLYAKVASPVVFGFLVLTEFNYDCMYSLQERKLLLERHGAHIARISVFEVCSCLALVDYNIYFTYYHFFTPAACSE